VNQGKRRSVLLVDHRIIKPGVHRQSGRFYLDCLNRGLRRYRVDAKMTEAMHSFFAVGARMVT
jgi:hypothetical protein